MKKTNKVISAFLCMLILMSVIFSVSFNVAAEIEYSFELDGLRYLEESDGTLTLVSRNTEAIPDDIVIPSEIDSKPVTKISQWALRTTDIKTLEIPASVTEIEEGAFDGCELLESAIVNANITTLKTWTFADCESLKTVTLPDTLETMERGVFERSGIESIEFPDSLETIGLFSFNSCKKLKSVKMNDGLKCIEQQSFKECTALTEISIPDSVIKMETSVFEGCTALESVKLSSGIEKVPTWSFENCTSLKYIEIPEGVKCIQGFNNCTSLESVTIPANITEIGYYAFTSCTSLKKVEFEERDTTLSLGNLAFAACSSLEEFDFSHIQDVESYTFGKCSALKKVDLSNSPIDSLQDELFAECSALQTVTLNNKIKSVNAACFKGCTNLEEVIIYPSTNRFYTSAFEDCENLKKLRYVGENNIKIINSNAFRNCYNLKEISLPKITKIYKQAFENCYNLSEVTIGDKLTYIAERAFFNCFSLPQLYVPKTVEFIGEMALGCFEEDGVYYGFSDFTVLGYKDSLADEYAEAYQMKYALPAPILSKVENKTDGIKISFKKLADVTGKYRVYRKTEGTSWKKLADITTASYTDTTAKAGTKYTYTVKYIGKPANSVYDKDGLSITRLTTPTVSKISNTNDGAKLTIKAVSGAAKYRVYVRSGSSWKSLGTTDTTTFTHTDVKSGTTYKYTVKAYDASSESSSAYKSEGFSNKFVAPPQITKTSNTETGVKITWGKVDGAEKYRVFVKSGSSWKKLKDTTSTSYTHTATESGKAYTYTVRCISSTGKSYTSGYDTTGTKALFLSTPTVTKISNTADGAKLTYTESIGASKYNIYANSGSGWKKIGESTTTTFIHTDAKSGVTYSYRVRAYDETGDYPSYYKTSAKNKFVAAPVISELSNTEKGVKITWGKVDGAEKYRVFVKSGSSWKKLKDTTSTSYTHTNVEDGKTYTYTVRCISSTGKSYKSGYDSTGVSILFEK